VANRLAAVLYKDYKDRGTDAPEAIERWRRLPISTRLPELRKPWAGDTMLHDVLDADGGQCGEETPC